MQSEPNIFRMTLIGICLFLIIGPLCILILEWTTGWTGLNIITQTFLTIFIIVTALFFILNELPMVLALSIDNNKITVKNLLTRKEKEFLFEDLDSFIVSTQLGVRSGFQFNLILLSHSKAIDPISLRYIYNLDKIIEELENNYKIKPKTSTAFFEK